MKSKKLCGWDLFRYINIKAEFNHLYFGYKWVVFAQDNFCLSSDSLWLKVSELESRFSKPKRFCSHISLGVDYKKRDYQYVV